MEMDMKLLIGIVIAFLIVIVPAIATCDITETGDTCGVEIIYWSTNPCIDQDINHSSPFSMSVRVTACPETFPMWQDVCYDECLEDYWGGSCRACKDRIITDSCDNTSAKVIIYYDNATCYQDTGWSAFNLSGAILEFDTSDFDLNCIGAYEIVVLGRSTNESESLDIEELDFTISTTGVWYGECTSSKGTWEGVYAEPALKCEAFKSLDLKPFGAKMMWTFILIIIGGILFAWGYGGLKGDNFNSFLGILILIEVLLIYIGAYCAMISWTILGLFIVGIMGFIGVKFKKMFG